MSTKHTHTHTYSLYYRFILISLGYIYFTEWSRHLSMQVGISAPTAQWPEVAGRMVHSSEQSAVDAEGDVSLLYMVIKTAIFHGLIAYLASHHFM